MRPGGLIEKKPHKQYKGGNRLRRMARDNLGESQEPHFCDPPIHAISVCESFVSANEIQRRDAGSMVQTVLITTISKSGFFPGMPEGVGVVEKFPGAGYLQICCHNEDVLSTISL